MNNPEFTSASISQLDWHSLKQEVAQLHKTVRFLTSEVERLQQLLEQHEKETGPSSRQAHEPVQRNHPNPND